MNRELMLYTKAGAEGNLVYPMMLHLDSRVFMHMVVAACMAVQTYFDPSSDRYVPPAEYGGNDFDRWLWSFRPDLPSNWRTLNSGDLYRAIWEQLDIVAQYVELRNSTDNWHVGEEHWLIAMVYTTLVVAHNWQVACVEISVAKNGAHFGSATGWFTHNRTKAVQDWPQKYGFPSLAIDLLPCERPNWEQRLQDDRDRRRAEHQQIHDTNGEDQ